MSTTWLICCPVCESTYYRTEGDWLMCAKCGHRWHEYKEAV